MGKKSWKSEYSPKRLPEKVGTALRETAWLEKNLRWQNQCLTWEGFAPYLAELNLAQLRLLKAEKQQPDLESLQRRRFNLLLAYRLQNLAKQPTTLPELIEWLLVEARCVDILPLKASEKIIAFRGAAITPLLEFMHGQIWDEAKGLAALVLGVICGKWEYNLKIGTLPPELRAFFQWGQQHGLPSDPAFYSRFLAQPDGTALLHSYEAYQQTTNRYRPNFEIFRTNLLKNKISPAQIVALLEVTQPIPLLIKKLKATLERKYSLLPYYNRFQHDFEALFYNIVRVFDASVVKLAVIFVQTVIDSFELLPWVAEGWDDVIIGVLQNILSFPHELVRSYLEIVIEQFYFFWKPTALKAEPNAEEIKKWYLEGLVSTNLVKKLLAVSHSPATIREIIALDILQPVGSQNYGNAEHLKEVVWTVRNIGFKAYPYAIQKTARIISKLSPEELKKYWRPLVEAFGELPNRGEVNLRVLMFNEAADSFSNQRKEIREEVTATLQHFSYFVNYVLKFPFDDNQAWILPPVLAQVERYRNEPTAWLEVLIAEIIDYKQARIAAKAKVTSPDNDYHTPSHLGDVSTINLLALTLAQDDLVTYKDILRQGLKQGVVNEDNIVKACSILKKLPQAANFFGQLLLSHYHDCIDLLIKLGSFSSLSDNELSLLQELEKTLPPEELPSVWCEISEKYPTLSENIVRYLYYRQLCGESLEIPTALARELNLVERLQTELTFLERAALAKDVTQKRLENLRLRLADSDRLQKQISQAASEKLLSLTNQAFLQVGRVQHKKCCVVKLAKLAPLLEAEITADRDIVNALEIFSHISQNRPLLLRLIRSKVRGESDWRLAMPANQKWLADFKDVGKEAEKWLAENRQTFEFKDDQIELYLENDPFQILHMGNYFDTCLSADGVNAFSTVANACDVNKRVIYAKNKAGKIIGRKLIAISSEWQLVGFRTYTGLENAGLNKVLRQIFDHYCRYLAESCNLELTDKGCCTVAKLVTQDWYDDGAVDWETEGTEKPAKAKPKQKKTQTKKRLLLNSCRAF